MLKIKTPSRLLLVAIGLGGLANFLFYDKNPGVSVLLFVALLLLTLFGLARLEKVSLAYRNLWLIVPLLFFATMIFVRANPTLTLLNGLAVLVLVLLLTFFYATDHIARLNLLDYPIVLALTGRQIISQPGPVVFKLGRSALAHKSYFRLLLRLGTGLLVALPVLALFTFLLSSADTIFAKYVNDLFELKVFNNLPDLLWQLAVILVVAWFCAGTFYFALGRKTGSEVGNARTDLPGLLALHHKLGFVEGATALFLVNLLFVFFAWVQFTYLFSDAAASRVNYALYRDYVRRGFGELLIATVLTLVLILGMRWMTRHQTKGQAGIFNALSTLMIGLALVMLVSSFQRMVVWENVEYYIHTDTRLYVRAFMLWLGLTFGWLAFTLWWRPERFAIGVFVAILGFVVTVNLMNPDADIAEYNLARYGKAIDNRGLAVRYLSNLSADAVPILAAALTQDEVSTQVKKGLGCDLYWRLIYIENDRTWREWPSFHLARAQAYDQLIALRKTGQIYQQLCLKIEP